MTNKDDYPRYICGICALASNGKRLSLSTYHLDICGVCNEWCAVTHPRNFGYPSVIGKWDRNKVLKELEKVRIFWVKQGNQKSLDAVEKRLFQERNK